tara:strand:- start:115 stop:2178 length:2064 start_codon:yes stop_codon:yes gene_type:complete
MADSHRAVRRSSLMTKHGGAAAAARRTLLKKKKAKKKPSVDDNVGSDDGVDDDIIVAAAAAPLPPLDVAGEWDFIGDDGAVHGPHTADEMIEWRDGGWFTEETLVAPTGSAATSEAEVWLPFDRSALGALDEGHEHRAAAHTDAEAEEWQRAEADAALDHDDAAPSDDGEDSHFDLDDADDSNSNNSIAVAEPVGVRALDHDVGAWSDLLPGERIFLREGHVTWNESNWRHGTVVEVVPSTITHRFRVRVEFDDEKLPETALCGPFGDLALRTERFPRLAFANHAFDYIRQRKGYFATLFLVTALATIEQVVYLLVLRTELWVHEERLLIPAPTPMPILGPIVIAPTPRPTYVEGVRWDVWATTLTPVCLILSELKVLLSLLHSPMLWTVLLTLINLGQITYIAAQTFMHSPVIPLYYIALLTTIHLLGMVLIPVAAACQGRCICGVHVSQRILARSLDGEIATPALLEIDVALAPEGSAAAATLAARPPKEFVGDGWTERERDEEPMLDKLRVARVEGGTARHVCKCVLKSPCTARASDFFTGFIVSLFFLTSPQVSTESFRKNGTLGYQFIMVAISFVLRVVFVVLRETHKHGEKCMLFVGLLEILLLLICIPALVILNVVVDLENLAACCLEGIIADGTLTYDAYLTFFDIGLSVFLFFFILLSPRVSSTSNFISTFAKCVKFE